VPLKRVNDAYILHTNTKFKLDAKIADSIKKDFFKKTELNIKEEKDFFIEEKLKKKELLKKEKKNKLQLILKLKKLLILSL
jgi:hypothetical protein